MCERASASAQRRRLEPLSGADRRRSPGSGFIWQLAAPEDSSRAAGEAGGAREPPPGFLGAWAAADIPGSLLGSPDPGLWAPSRRESLHFSGPPARTGCTRFPRLPLKNLVSPIRITWLIKPAPLEALIWTDALSSLEKCKAHALPYHELGELSESPGTEEGTEWSHLG